MNNKSFKSILFATILLLIFGISSTFAQSATADSLVKELYKIHDQDLKSDGNRILNGKDRKNLDKFFDKSLADFIWKDLTTNTDEIGVLDFDPFYNAQDFEIKNLVIGAAKMIGTKATIIVKFTNAGSKETLNYQLVKRGTVWKIADIKYADGGSLVKYFKDATKSS